MAYTEEQLNKKLDALNDAIYSGVLEIEYEGRKQKFHKFSDLMKARNLLLKELGKSPKKKRVTLAASKNL